MSLEPPHPSIAIRTSKTGETVCIPIYERLLAELELAWGRKKPADKYVWPEQAKLYRKKHAAISRKLSRLFANAVGVDQLHANREYGLRKASVIGFHSLRTTWITEALARGVPIETVKLISGHKTVEVVTKHYWHPNKEQVRNALQTTMLRALIGGSSKSEMMQPPSPVLAEALKRLTGITSRNFKKRAKEAAELIQRAKDLCDQQAMP